MRYSTRVRLKKYIYIAIAIIAFIALNIVLFTTVLNKSKSIERSVVKIASGENTKVYPYDGGVIAVEGTEVTSYDYSGQKQFTAQAPWEDMQAYRNDGYTILWYSNLAVILNSAGEVRHTQDLSGADAFLATCNSSQFAVAVIEEGQTKIKVYDFNGIEIWDNLYTDMTIMDIGYFGEKDAQLWTLALDYHGTIPVTRLNTNHPGSSQTGRITINDQVCYAVEPFDESVYIVGTHHIQSRTYTDTKLSEMLINGWALQSSYVGEKNTVSFLMAPVDTTGTDTPLSALWYIKPGQEQYRISMPAGIKRAVLTERKIYAISKEGVYYMNFNGQKRNFSKLPFVIDEVVGECSGKAVVLRAGSDYYLVGLNK